MDRGGNSPPQGKDRPPLVSTPTTRVIRTFEEIRIPVKTEEVYPELECAMWVLETHFHLGHCSTSFFVDAPTSWAPLNPSFRAGMWEYFENRLPFVCLSVPHRHSFCGPCAWKWIKTNTNVSRCLSSEFVYSDSGKSVQHAPTAVLKFQ